MTNAVTAPPQPKIYHITHADRLSSIVGDGSLWCDAEVVQRERAGTTIGMSDIKRRRVEELCLGSHPDLHVGSCVPFYFCPRSVMLYLIHRGNHPDLAYRQGQRPILHLEADLHTAVEWADAHRSRWAFTLSNAGSRYFEDRNDLARLDEIDWNAVQARDWRQHKEGKQAEFLVEGRFPWNLIERIGVHSSNVRERVVKVLPPNAHRPAVDVCADWYY